MRVTKRGEIYYVNLDPVVGSEQGGRRPVIVISSNNGNYTSDVMSVVPLTSSKQKLRYYKMTIHNIIDSSSLKQLSMILGEHVRTIDKSRILRKMGRLTQEEMEIVQKCVDCNVSNSTIRKNQIVPLVELEEIF